MLPPYRCASARSPRGWPHSCRVGRSHRKRHSSRWHRTASRCAGLRTATDACARLPRCSKARDVALRPITTSSGAPACAGLPTALRRYYNGGLSVLFVAESSIFEYFALSPDSSHRVFCRGRWSFPVPLGRCGFDCHRCTAGEMIERDFVFRHNHGSMAK